MSGPSVRQCYRTKLLVCQSKKLSWTHKDTVREERILKHKISMSEERTVVCRAALTQTEMRVLRPLHRDLPGTTLLK